MKAPPKLEHAGTTLSRHPQGCKNVALPGYSTMSFAISEKQCRHRRLNRIRPMADQHDETQEQKSIETNFVNGTTTIQEKEYMQVRKEDSTGTQ
jgi:hypothetical protein